MSSSSTFENYFSVSVFFVLFRESLEVAVIISVMLSFISRLDEGLQADKQRASKDGIDSDVTADADSALHSKSTLHLKNSNQSHNRSGTAHLARLVWIGTLAAFVIVCIVGAVLIYIWYKFARNLFEESEALIEGILMLIASVFLTATGLMFAKGYDLHDRMEKKLAVKFNQETSAKKDASTESFSSKANSLFFIIPFLSVLREGLESVLLFAGVGLSAPPTSIPLAAISGILLGLLLGFLLAKLQRTLSLRAFFTASAYLLLLMSAGFFVKGVYEVEEHIYLKSLPTPTASSSGLDVDLDQLSTLPFNRNSVIWYFPSTDPDKNLGYGVLNSLLGYEAIATVATVTCYCLYWVFLVAILALLKVKQTRQHSRHLVDKVHL